MEKDKKVALGVLGGVAVVTGLLAWTLSVEAKPPIPPADIVISDLIIEPVEVFVGEPVSISVVVTNIGESAGSYEVICEVL